MLDDDSRAEADRFAVQYRALRMREGWADSSGREDPEGGQAQLWKGRLRSMSEAAAVLDREGHARSRPVVADVGSGGGWAARLLMSADVIAFDLLDVTASSAALSVRATIRRLPLRDATVDAILYAASLHYSPVAEAVSEAARVLRAGGLMVAIDSPIYRDASAQQRAAARTAAYYASAGCPMLSDHYHPINVAELRSALIDSGFEIEQLNVRQPTWWPRRFLGPKSPASLVVARRRLR